MGLVALKPAPSPAIALTGAGGAPGDRSAYSGRVVVITFFDSTCDDICPVLGAEINAADAALGSETRRVLFLSVNTDPLSPTSSASPAKVYGADAAPGNWVFASGRLVSLQPVWNAYHVTIDVTRGGEMTHNDLMYFVDPSGLLRYEATPFADEGVSGRYSLPSTLVASWGEGIANVARELLR
jgi:protein SCO1/2